MPFEKEDGGTVSRVAGPARYNGDVNRHEEASALSSGCRKALADEHDAGIDQLAGGTEAGCRANPLTAAMADLIGAITEGAAHQPHLAVAMGPARR